MFFLYKGLRPCVFLLLLVSAFFETTASPISDAVLSRDLDDAFDTLQAERRDKIEYIDRYEALGETETKEDGKRVRTISFRFFVKTRRGADENFKLSIRYEYRPKEKRWAYTAHEVTDLVQTRPPVIRPAKQSLPKKEIVYDLVRSELRRQSSESRSYEVHRILSEKSAVFQWAENYTVSEFRFPLIVKLIVKGRVTNDYEYFLCKWTTLVRFDPGKKKWLLRDLDANTNTKEISQSCKPLEQTFLEKMNNLFPGEGK